MFMINAGNCYISGLDITKTGLFKEYINLFSIIRIYSDSSFRLIKL